MLKCPECGAAAAASDVRCGYCGVQLQTIACASCLGMIFAGARHCSHCGARVFGAPADGEAATARQCPRCRRALVVSAVGSAFLEECGGCGGVWVDAQSFAQICKSREQQAAYVGAGSPLPRPSLGEAAQHETVAYVKCPECAQLMNRVNFARCSGVVVDVCKRHGTWFDRDELRQIVAFIRAGGLDAARDKERAAIELDKQRLKERERGASVVVVGGDDRHDGYADAFEAAGDLIRWLID